MVRLSAIAFVLLAAPIAFCAPITRRQVELQDYSAFQISGGKAGNAQAEAAAVFVDPFQGLDLAQVSDETLNNLSTMRELAEDAETELFNPQIAAATGDEAKALQIGKIKNKVLKLTGFQQVLKIKIAKGQAAGDDTSADESKLAIEDGKLQKNIASDVAKSGQTSQAATGTVSPRRARRSLPKRRVESVEETV